MSIRLPPIAQFSLKTGFSESTPLSVHRSRARYLAAYNCPSSLIHAVEALYQAGISSARGRILPDIGRSMEPEVRLYRVEHWEAGFPRLEDDYTQVRVSINVREDTRLHNLLPLVAIGLAPVDAIKSWRQGRASATTSLDVDSAQFPFTPLRGYHAYYFEPGAMPEDWSNQVTPAERIALQICERLPQVRDPSEPPHSIQARMLKVANSRLHEDDNPLAGLIVDEQSSAISQMGTILDLIEVFLTHAMSTIAGIDMLGGFEFIIPFEPPEGRQSALVLDKSATSEKVARWYNAYPHRTVESFQERMEPGSRARSEHMPTRWAHTDVDIKRITERIADWYKQGSVKDEPWARDRDELRYKLPAETLDSDEMLSLARAFLPEFIPDFPRQVFVTGGMNIEGMLLGLIGRWMRDGAVLGLDYADWALFTPEQQVVLCGMLAQRGRNADQFALFETALRCTLDFGIKTWLETFRTERIGLDRPDCASPLAQLGFCLPLGGIAALHAPSLKVRIPRDYTRDVEARAIEQKLTVLERLFVPAHIPVQHIWEIDWMRLGETAYLRMIDSPENPDLVPTAVRLLGTDDD